MVLKALLFLLLQIDRGVQQKCVHCPYLSYADGRELFLKRGQLNVASCDRGLNLALRVDHDLDAVLDIVHDAVADKQLTASSLIPVLGLAR